MRKSRLISWLSSLSGAVVVLILAATAAAVLNVGQRMGQGAPTTPPEQLGEATSGPATSGDDEVDLCVVGPRWKQVTAPDSPLPEPSFPVTVTRYPLPPVTPAPDPSGGPAGGWISEVWEVAPEPLPDDAMVRDAGMIAVVTVVRCEPGRWSTRDGKMPPMKDGQFLGTIPGIWRPMILRVETPVRGGARAGEELTVRVAGGTVDGWTLEIEGLGDRFQRGMRLLAVLNRASTGTDLWMVAEASSVDSNGMATDTLRPQRKFPLEERIQQLQAAWDRVRG